MTNWNVARPITVFASTVLLIFAVASAIAQSEAKHLFVAVDRTPFTSEPTGEPIGTLHVTSEVKVLEEQEGFSHIAGTGWAELDAQKNPTGSVFTNETDQIQVADINDFSQIVTAKPEGDWAEVQFEGWVPSDTLTDDISSLYAKADEVYSQYCNSCHAGYAPPVETIKAGYPVHMVPDTAHRMAMGTGISEEDLNLVIHWLQKDRE